MTRDSSATSPDTRDELIEDMRRVLREAMIFWQINSDLSERYCNKWQQAQNRIADLEFLLQHVLNAYPDIEEWSAWKEVMQP